jgi:selenocysteine lyase/cysteine desulfurase
VSPRRTTSAPAQRALRAARDGWQNRRAAIAEAEESRVTPADWPSLWDAGPGYLDTASYGLPPRMVMERLGSALDEWRVGRGRWENWSTATEAARASFARLVRTDPGNVSIGSTVSELVGTVAAALPSGAKVVVPAEEFTSNLFPYLAHADRGVEVVTVPARDLADAIDRRTTLVAFSVVQSSTGAVADVEAITKVAHDCGALVLVDATQSLPWIDLPADGVDAYVCAVYKWLMAPRGAAFMVTSPELRRTLRPLFANWFAGAEVHTSYYGPPLRLAEDARRFDLSPAWFSWVGTAAALELVETLGVPAIAAHDVGLANTFRAAVGLAPEESAIVSLDAPDAGARLEAAGIRASVRGGRVRLSFHVYNTAADAERAAEALAPK